MSRAMGVVVAGFGLVLALAACTPNLKAADAGMPVVYQDDFQKGDPLAKWQPTDPTQWKIATVGDNKLLSLHKRKSAYKTKVRSPFSFAILRDVCVGDFVLDLKMQSTTKDYGHRDLCLFFGHQDPTHFYYVHMALRADPCAHSVMVVDGKPRVTLIGKGGQNMGSDSYRTKGLVWGDGWHHVRLVRKVATGLIEVYFDDMTTPIMRTHDKRFAWGTVGVGSFDDTGNYDDIVLRGIKVEAKK